MNTPVIDPIINPKFAGKKLRWSPLVGCAHVLPSMLDNIREKRQ